MSDNSATANVNILQRETNDSSTVSAPKPGNGLSKILLIDECSAKDMPKVLKTLMTSLDNPTKIDILVVLLYILTVESGFIPSCCKPLEDDYSVHYDVRRLNALTEMPPNWKGDDGLYILEFFLRPFPDDKCHLICNTTSHCLSASIFLSNSCDSLQTFSIFLNPADYVYCVHTRQRDYAFKSLKNLSVNFKNQVVLPLKSCILAKSNLFDGLLALPEEILYYVMGYLNSKCFLTFTSTCKLLHNNFANDNVIWKRLVYREFIVNDSPTGKVNWKEFYKKNFKFHSSKATNIFMRLSKILLIDECSAKDMPKVLKTLMTSLDNPTKTDLLVVLLYILTVESGFIPSCCKPLEDDYSVHYDVRRLNALTEMPPNWKGNDGLYKLEFFLRHFPDDKCHLICNTTLRRLSASMFLCDSCDSLQTFSIFLNPADYVYCVNTRQRNYVFRNLKNLSVNFKNQVALPLKSCILAKSNLFDGLLALPEEILYNVIDYLNSKCFLRLTSTCKVLHHNFSNDNVIWKRLVYREFIDENDIPTEKVNWKAFYKKNYKLNESKKLRSFAIRPVRYMRSQ